MTDTIHLSYIGTTERDNTIANYDWEYVWATSPANQGAASGAAIAGWSYEENGVGGLDDLMRGDRGIVYFDLSGYSDSIDFTSAYITITGSHDHHGSAVNHELLYLARCDGTPPITYQEYYPWTVINSSGFILSTTKTIVLTASDLNMDGWTGFAFRVGCDVSGGNPTDFVDNGNVINGQHYTVTDVDLFLTYTAVVPPNPADLDIYIVEDQDSYSVGQQITVHTNVPQTLEEYGPFYAWLLDNDSDFVDVWPGGSHQPIPVGEQDLMLTLTIDTGGTWNVPGTHWQLCVANWDPMSGSFYYIDRFNFSVANFTSGYYIFPESYRIPVGQQLKFSVRAGELNRDFHAQLINIENGSVMKNQTIRTDEDGLYFGTMLNVVEGGYFLRLLNSTTHVTLNVSSTLLVQDPDEMNKYAILIYKTSNLAAGIVNFYIARSQGTGFYCFNVYDPSGNLIFTRKYGADGHNVELPQLTIAGKYKAAIFDDGGSENDYNAEIKLFTVGHEDEITDPNDPGVDNPGVPVAWQGSLMVISFFGFLGLGLVISLKTQNFLAFPSVLFGGLMVCSIPDTPLAIFPPVMIFIGGLVLILLIYFALRR